METNSDINNCLNSLKMGGLILYPTDTVWGLGCDATDEFAVSKLFRLKRRNEFKSMIILVSDEKMLSKYLREIPWIALELIRLSVKPLTIVFDNGINLAKNVLAPDGSIAARIPNDEFCRKLIHRYGKPVVSTSANISGEPVPGSFATISNYIKENVDYAVKYKRNISTKSMVSSIIKVKQGGEFQIIRK